MRVRDLGLVPGQLPAGEFNAITDVPGVLVGHTTLIQGEAVRTGVTAVLPHGDNLFREKVAAGVATINGFGKAVGFEQIRELGVIETPILLTNTLNVGKVADALIAYMLRTNPEIGLATGSINPVVGECNDQFLNDLRGRHVQAEHVFAALESAAGGAVAEGNVGAGTGTLCFQFKGGIGTASRHVDTYTVGALVQTNYGQRAELLFLGAPMGQHLLDEALPQVGGGSIMMIIATDAPLDARQLTRLANRSAFALGRTGSVGHHGSGDFAIAFSTTNRTSHTPAARINPPLVRDDALDPLFTAVVESLEEAILNALLAAETLTGRSGNTAFALPKDRLVELLKRYGRL
ncbi:MAG: P1 family peptidase [Anaerolineae bacterium]|nr:P1 family peptidase [Anaerolineae bacterium]